VRLKKQKPSKVVAILGEFDIEKLPSGNYNLVVDIRDKNNQSILLRKSFFQRNNPEYDFRNKDFLNANLENTFVSKIDFPDTLVEYLKCIRPIADRVEKNHIDNQV